MTLTPCVMGKVVSGLLNLPDVNVAWRKFTAIDFRHAKKTTAARSLVVLNVARTLDTNVGWGTFLNFLVLVFIPRPSCRLARKGNCVVGNGRSSFVVSSSQHVLSPS